MQTVVFFNMSMTRFLQAATVNNVSKLLRNTQQKLTEPRRYIDNTGLKLNPHKPKCIL